ncbi:Membrane lipoprotein TmpC [subsurface metagenome]
MRNVFKTLTLLIIVVLVFGLVFSSCKKKEEAVEAPKEEAKLIVAMATDVGGLGDKSFNDAVDFNLEPRVVESKQQTDYVPNLAGLAEDGAEVVFGVGFLMADALLEAAANNPDTAFAGIDIWVDPSTAPKNVQGLLFKEQESGYVSGIVAGLLTKKYASVSDRLNDDNVVGMVLGMDIPPVERFQAGFYAGVKSVNPDCKVLSVVTGTFTDQAKGKESALAMIEQGADIIFQIAGLTGLGALNAADEAGVAGIGVDVDQYAVAPDAIITSAVKGITQASYLTIKDVLDGKFVGGNNRVFGINEGATGIAPFHNWNNTIPNEVKDIVDKAIADLKSGAVVAPASRAEAGYEG